ncbi:MarR family winged helix-turn-helix transcriptional regulator [Trujillonella humicola]|uniref:MarR family winged helix-turn-helix transcriptional regulator n=1 Tax=Trujillonella humicola TaxID=3383699 RepID=UPI003905967D
MSLPAPATPGARPAQLHTLGEQLARMMRQIHALKAATAGDSRERAAHVLLFPLDRLGAMRQGALADLVHADPSTVSRHVATLVEGGLVQRVPDERDGRASLLVVTGAGQAALAALRAERSAVLARVTADWDDAELSTLTDLFGRLLDGLSAVLPADATPDALPTPRETR